MAGVTDFLFNGQPVPAQPTGSDTQTSYPLWLQQYQANIANAATNLAGTPYTPFPGQQVAQPSPTTQEAQDLTQKSLWNYSPALNQAYSLTQQAGTPISSGDIQSYMNPYTNSVVGGLQQASNYNLTQNQLPAIASQFVGAGQAASPQMRAADNDALYKANQSLNQATAGALESGYNGALGTALAEQGAKQTAGAQFGQIGALTQQLGQGQIGALSASGSQQDTTNQANIDAARSDFNNAQQWPYQNLGFAANVIRGQNIPTNTQTVGTQFNPGQTYTASPLASFVGSAAAGQALTNQANNPYRGYRRGGPVGGALGMAAGGMRLAA